MLGIAYFELDDALKAEKSFLNASQSKKYKDSAKAWLEYL